MIVQCLTPSSVSAVSRDGRYQQVILRLALILNLSKLLMHGALLWGSNPGSTFLLMTDFLWDCFLYIK